VNLKPATPKDASAVILLNQDFTKVLWAQRSQSLAFLGGWHAFPGGKLDAGDAEIRVKNCADKELERFIVCAVRELFEETGVLLARGGEKLTRGQRASLHDDLINERFPPAEIFQTWGLWIDAEDFFYTGFWTTPEFSPVRFKTRFFLAVCPSKQLPYAAIGELTRVEFIEPERALKKWENAEVLISPPVLLSLKDLAAENTDKIRENITAGLFKSKVQSPKSKVQRPKTKDQKLKTVSQKLLEKSQKLNGKINYVELNPRVIVFPLKTETLPPATHTNCFIVGRREFVVIDAASKDESEQFRLFDLVDSFIESGAVCREIIVSHLHPDHFGGETALQKHLREKFGLEIPVSAHKLTAKSLDGKIEIQKFIQDEEVFYLKDERGETFGLKALHTPGHARGHLCFYDAEKGFLLSSDNVVGTGSVVIAPPEGNLIDYLNSLERMKNLPNLKHLCGSHGAAVFDAKAKIENYIAHRLEREKQIIQAIQAGAKTPPEIVRKVYIGLDEKLIKLAEKSVEAHLEKLKAEDKISLASL
jgi:endoribonuclease LACTB2